MVPTNQVRAARGDAALREQDLELARLKQEIALRHVEQHAATVELDALERRYGEVSAQREAKAAELAKVLENLRAIEEDLSASAARHSAVEQQIAAAKALEAELASREAGRKELEDKIAAAEAAKAQIAAHLQEIESATAAAVAAAEAKRSELQVRLDAARELVVRLEQALAWTAPAVASPAPPAPPAEAGAKTDAPPPPAAGETKK